MKKIKLLFAAMLSMMAWTGVMATVTQPTMTTDPSNPVLYTIKNFRTGKYATYTGASTQLSQDAAITKAGLWYFEENGAGVSIVPAKEPSVKLVSHSSATATGAVWYLVENPYRAGYFCVTLSNNASSSCWDDQGQQTKIGYWQPSSSDNQGTSWSIEPFDMTTPIEVTYELYVGETKSSSTTVLQEANSEVAIPASMIAGMSYNGGYQPKAYYTYTPEGTIGDEDCTIRVTRTETPGVVHALTDLSNAKSYTIACDRGSLLTSNGTIASTSHANFHNAAPAKFAVLSYEDHYYLYSVADKKFVQNTGSLSDMPTNETFDAIIMTAQTDPYFLFTFKIDDGETEGGKSQGLNTNGTGALNGCVINDWTTPDQGDQYYMIEAADFDATDALAALEAQFHPACYATYVVKDEAGNTLFTSEPQPVAPGANITAPLPEFQRPFYTYSEVDVTISEQNTTVEFTATWNGPIDLAEDYASITWKNLYINRGEDGGIRYLANSETLPGFVGGPTDKQLASDMYQWGFVGNPYDGLKIYNKYTGSAKTLTNGSSIAMADGEFLWTAIAKNGNGILIGVPINGTNQYLNQSGGATSSNLGLWSSTTDVGSTFYVSEAPDIVVTNVYYDAVYEGEIVKTVMAPGIAIGDDIPAVPAELDNGYVTLSTPEGTVTEENQHVTVNVTWNGPFEISASVANAKWYSMTINGDKSVIVYASEPYYPHTATSIQKMQDESLWAFMTENPYEVSLYNKSKGDGFTLAKDEEKVVMREGEYFWEIGKNNYGFILKEKGTAFNTVSTSTTGSVLGFWNIGSALAAKTSAFQVIEAVEDLSISMAQVGENTYATTYLPFAVTIPDGLTAYTGSLNADNSVLTLTPLSDIIPAYTAVVLEGTETSYVFTKTAYVPPINDNVLQGLLDAGKPEGALTLQVIDGELGFYTFNGTSIGANKAYLVLPDAGVKGIQIRFGGEDAIQTVKAGNEQNVIFDLAGRRVQQAQKGVYIVNGRKIIR